MSKRKPEVTLRTAGGILYKATRRKVKNLNIRVHPDGTVAVSIPFHSSWEEADRFVLRHRDWVQEAQRDLADREARTDQLPGDKADPVRHEGASHPKRGFGDRRINRRRAGPVDGGAIARAAAFFVHRGKLAARAGLVAGLRIRKQPLGPQ